MAADRVCARCAEPPRALSIRWFEEGHGRVKGTGLRYGFHAAPAADRPEVRRRRPPSMSWITAPLGVPSRALHAAMIRECLADLLRGGRDYDGQPSPLRVRVDAARWMLSGADDPLGFEASCALTGINADAVRDCAWVRRCIGELFADQREERP